MDWAAAGERAERRYRDGLTRLQDEPDARQKQLVRVANAAGAAGLSRLMERRQAEARAWLVRAAERYRESFAGAPSGSWGRPIGAVKARLLADDGGGAAADARWTLELGCERAESPIGRYAAALALLTLGEDEAAAAVAQTLCAEPEEAFPTAVAEALLALASGEGEPYAVAVQHLLASFETRDAFLEDIPVADTVIVLEALAERRGLAVRPSSALLPD